MKVNIPSFLVNPKKKNISNLSWTKIQKVKYLVLKRARDINHMKSKITQLGVTTIKDNIAW